MADYLADARSFVFPLNTPAGENILMPVTPPRPSQLVVGLAPVARHVLLNVSMLLANGGLRASSLAAAVDGNPYILYGFTEDAVGGLSPTGTGGLGRGLTITHLAAPYVPVFFLLPANHRVYAVVRGRAPTVAGDPASVVVSVTTTESVEPSADGQTKKLIDGVAGALKETISPGILAAAKMLGIVAAPKKG